MEKSIAHNAPVLRRHLVQEGFGLAGWSLLSVFFASQMWVGYSQNGSPATFHIILLVALCTWGTWALFAPAVLVLARRVPFERGGILRALAVHALAAAVVIAAKLWVDAQALGLALRRAPRISPTEIHMALLTYAALVAAVHVAALRRNARERELFASRLESRLAQAQRPELQAQLHPHFLFNPLHAISALVRS